MSVKSDLRIVRMGEPHLGQVFSLIDHENWGWEFAEIRAIHSLDPGSSLVALDGKEVVGLVTCIDFGSVAAIVHVIVRKGWRGKGVGVRMMERVLADLDSRGVPTVELHADPKAVDFYAPFSFKKFEDISFFVKNAPHRIDGPGEASSGRFEWLSKDRLPTAAGALSPALGYDERSLLEALARGPPDNSLARTEDGRCTAVALSRIGHDINAVGPWTMDRPSKDDAVDMIRVLLSAAPAKRMDLLALSSSEVAGHALEVCGFELAKAGIVRLVRSTGRVSPYSESVLSIGHLCMI